MGAASKGNRLTWPQIVSSELRGRWVALDRCRYDARTAQPVEGTVIDADEDLVELCSRIQDSENRHCAILFCDAPAVEPMVQRGPTPVPPRSFTTH